LGGVEGREYARFVTPEDAVRIVVEILNR